MNIQELPPPVALYHLSIGHYVTQAIYVAATLGIADHLADGPRSADDLARAVGAHAPSLRRVLRLLASAGVLIETPDGRFESTPIGSCLRSGTGTFRAVARLFGGPGVWASWGKLLDTVRTGETAWHQLYGSDSFAYFEQHPDEAAVFDEAMGAFTAMIAMGVGATYDFSQFRTVMDVGGGEGALILGILRERPGLRGVLFDLPRLADGARRRIAAADLSDRCEFVGGDFFEAVPPGCDAYMLKHVIHDWDDERAVKILTSCRRAIGSRGKLLIVESLYPEHVDQSLVSRGAAANDVNMMVCTGGRQRSEREFRDLYRAAGFELSAIVPVPGMPSVIEGAPV
jgi:orsellinic acid C2-O-methyltransferase